MKKIKVCAATPNITVADPKANAKEIFNTFKDEYGSVCCGTITNNGEDKSPCVDCCVFIANKVADLWDE